MKKEYIKIGKCIWCLKEKAEVTFFNRPHTIPKSLGANNIGFDICDNCNTFFGIRDKNSKYKVSVELAFKEVFNVTKHLLYHSIKANNENKQLKSVFFNFYKSKNKFIFKDSFKFQRNFQKNFARQFKRGVYEVFLQEYHRNTGRGLYSKFDKLRDFVRNDIGDLPIYIAVNNGLYFIDDDKKFSLKFNEFVNKEINDYGFYTVFLFGHVLYLEVTPKAKLIRDIYLNKQLNNIYPSIKELVYVTDMDFTLQKINKK